MSVKFSAPPPRECAKNLAEDPYQEANLSYVCDIYRLVFYRTFYAFLRLLIPVSRQDPRLLNSSHVLRRARPSADESTEKEFAIAVVDDEACHKPEKCREMLLVGLSSYGEDAQRACGRSPKDMRVIHPTGAAGRRGTSRRR
jgi:hypothetical protein